MTLHKALIICGPTGSGKSEIAHRIALSCNGEVVNIDCMQVYKQIRIITASPDDPRKQELPYHLYNFLDISASFSAAKYAELVSPVLKDIRSRGKLPIITGGTGMYIGYLINGYSQIPEISDEVRRQARDLLAQIAQEALYSKLQALDPTAARQIKPADAQRTLRAYEVFMQTGKSIIEFHTSNILPLPNFAFDVALLSPERNFLRSICDERLVQMFKGGAIEEVGNVKDQLKTAPLASKALGVSEILQYLEGKITISEALQQAQTRTKQYAKRQTTWFRHQLQNAHSFSFANKNDFDKIYTQIEARYL